MTNRPLFLGLGSPHGDDQAGWLVIERLHQRGVSTADAVALNSPNEIWDRCTPDRQLILCDAAVGIGADGTVRHWNWPGVLLPERSVGTHDFPLGEVLTVGQSLGLCPPEVVIWTISASKFAPEDEMSFAVRQAAVSLAQRLYEECVHA